MQIIKIFIISLLFLGYVGCANKRKDTSTITNTNLSVKQVKILQMAHKMSIEDKEIIQGSCWDYINKIYIQAGFPNNKRKIIFRSQKRGPYADQDMIKPGDWLYYINKSYYNIEHSGLFVKWVDYQAKQALILSYAGKHRKIPARYKVYDISKVYYILRAK